MKLCEMLTSGQNIKAREQFYKEVKIMNRIFILTTIFVFLTIFVESIIVMIPHIMLENKLLKK